MVRSFQNSWELRARKEGSPSRKKGPKGKSVIVISDYNLRTLVHMHTPHVTIERQKRPIRSEDIGSHLVLHSVHSSTTTQTRSDWASPRYTVLLRGPPNPAADHRPTHPAEPPASPWIWTITLFYRDQNTGFLFLFYHNESPLRPFLEAQSVLCPLSL